MHNEQQGGWRRQLQLMIQSTAINRKTKLTVREQLLFFLPLAITSFLIIISHSLFNAGLARLPDPEVMIAAFAVAKSLMHIFQSPVTMIRQTVTALIDRRGNLRITTKFLLLVSASVILLLGITAFSGLSRLIFGSVMGLAGKTLDQAVLMLHILFLFPIMVAIRDYFVGFSLKFRIAPLITIASIIRIIYVLIFIIFIDQMSALPPAYLASLMFIGGVAIEAAIMVLGNILLVGSFNKKLDQLQKEQSKKPRSARLTYTTIIYFYLPLIVTRLIQTTIMPIINSGLARTSEPDLSISVFAVAWSLGMIILSPFIMFHQVPLNFIDEDGRSNQRSVQKFALLLALTSAVVLFLIAFTDLGYLILTKLIGTSHQVSILAADVLKLMCLLPFLMAAREYYWGMLMKRRQTIHIWKGKAINLFTILVSVAILIFLAPANAAIIGAIAFICSESAEFIFLYFRSRRSSS